jgi:hypothetical protein
MKIQVNRAPVLTLWAAVVAERLGFDEDEALTLGRAVAGLTAQSKGQWLGIYEKRKEAPSQDAEAPDDLVFVNLMDRAVPALRTPQGLRAADKGQPADPEAVRRYLISKFGEYLPAVEDAMGSLAASYPVYRLAEEAYALYERFRPPVEKGKRGWGAAGDLDLERIASLRLG